ncbi:MAG: patatin-like phospholipase family protein [Pseudomonadota bacterium]
MMRLVRSFYRVLAALLVLLFAYLLLTFVYNQFLVTHQTALPAYPQQRAAEPTPTGFNGKNSKHLNILAIDGGALWGLAELEVLKAIEAKSGRQIYELFDVVAGSSTGAIIASLLLLPDPGEHKPQTAEAAIEDYEAFASKVMDRPPLQFLLSAFGLMGPLFRNEGRIQVAEEVFGDATFGQLVVPTLLPGFVVNREGYQLFRSWRAENSQLQLSSLVTAVTSAEAVFPSIELENYDGGSVIVSDPAYVLNSPALAAYIAVREEAPSAETITVVTIGPSGTFSVADDIRFRGGFAQWITPIIRMSFVSQSSTAQQSLNAHHRYDSSPETYNFRLAPNVDGTSPFNTSRSNLDRISQKGRTFVADNDKLIDEVVARLLEKHEP